MGATRAHQHVLDRSKKEPNRHVISFEPVRGGAVVTRLLTQELVREPASLDARSVDAVRVLAVDAVETARSGHPGAPMGLAPVASLLWTRFLRHDPRDPSWPDRDRFVLSAGHASALLYALLHLTGYDVTLQDLRGFRQWGSHTPGHPERGHTPGVETTTGPLGQGIGNAVGMAIAERILADRFNRDGLDVVDHRTFCICSDGDLMEGISHEAASLAGHLGLGRLVLVYDDNRISIDGPTGLAFSEDVAARFRSYGWHVARVSDGEDVDALDDAIREAVDEPERPSLVAVRTHIASGAPTKQDTAGAHGAPLGPDEVRAWKDRIGWSHEPFDVPDDAAAVFAACVPRGAELHAAWRATFEAWAKANTELAREWRRRMTGELPEGWGDALPDIGAKTMATRKASGAVLAAIASALPELVGGSADLTESTSTAMPEATFELGRPGRFLHFGVREHAMGAVMNGLALHGGVRPFGGTFLVFSDYMRPSIRLAALMGLPVVFVFTHDSIGLGEDGPTHQPVEHLAALRAIPGLVVIRPADAAETVEAWRVALERTDGPTALVLSRQDLAPVNAAADAPHAHRGAYAVAGGEWERPGKEPDVLLIATGSEVRIALDAADALAGEGAAVRVVSMPSCELFLSQPPAYRDEVLPPAVTARVVVEAAASIGWERFVGMGGRMVTLDRFGASAPGPVAQAELGFTPEAVAGAAREAIADGRKGGERA